MIEHLPWSHTMANDIPWALLTIIALGLEVVFATLALLYTRRLLRLNALPLSDDMNGYQRVCRRLRENEPVTRDELNLAARIIDVRGHPLAYTVPLAFMTTGVFYILGSLEYLHGAHPSERTFLGVIPMITSTSTIARMRSTARLKRRLSSARVIDESPAQTTRDSADDGVVSDEADRLTD